MQQLYAGFENSFPRFALKRFFERLFARHALAKIPMRHHAKHGFHFIQRRHTCREDEVAACLRASMQERCVSKFARTDFQRCNVKLIGEKVQAPQIKRSREKLHAFFSTSLNECPMGVHIKLQRAQHFQLRFTLFSRFFLIVSFRGAPRHQRFRIECLKLHNIHTNVSGNIDHLNGTPQ